MLMFVDLLLQSGYIYFSVTKLCLRESMYVYVRRVILHFENNLNAILSNDLNIVKYIRIQ